MYKSKNHIQQLADHVHRNFKKGYTMDSLKFSLMNQGYSRISVEKAIDIVNERIAEKIPKIKEMPQITYRVVSDERSFEVIQVPIKKRGWLRRLFD